VNAIAALGFGELAEHLRVLGHESRLEILEALRAPRSLAQIRVAPRRVLAGENPERAMARQSVQEHLAKLVAAGLVVEREEPGGARAFVMNRPRLYQVLESLHQAARAMPSAAFVGDATADLAPGPRPRAEEGPRLVAVRGLMEGASFPLREEDLREGRGWILGRREGLHVSLAYDPYVSLENGEVRRDAEGYWLHDVPGSKNGTSLNWARLPPGGRARLRAGDVVGVGRSLLVFQDLDARA